MANPNSAPNFKLRRALAAGAVVLGGLGVGAGAHEGAQFIEHAQHKAQVKQKIAEYYSRPNQAEHANEVGNAPFESGLYTVKAGDYPIKIAQEIAGKGYNDEVVSQITGQVGDATEMQIGDSLVLPTQELDPQTVTVQAPEQGDKLGHIVPVQQQ